MMNNNKILTVSYGTFSCTLEGFDDSFGTMKAIAEYFRDLASDDRYFGAEPPQPDAEMLTRIAQKEVSRRVEAREQDGQIVLSALKDNAQQELADQTPAASKLATTAVAVASEAVDQGAGSPVEDDQPQVEEGLKIVPAQAEAEPVETPVEADEILDDLVEDESFPVEAEAETTAVEPAFVEDENDIVPGQPDAEVEAFFADSPSVAEVEEDAQEETAAEPQQVVEAEDIPEITAAPDSIAAKLQRIRAVVAQHDEPDEADDYLEDEHAETEAVDEGPVATRDLIAEARADIEEALDADKKADAQVVMNDETADAEDVSAILSRLEADSDEADTDDVAVADAEPTDEPDRANERSVEDTVSNLFDENEESLADINQPEATDHEIPKVSASEELTAEIEETATPRARVIKVKRADLEAAIESGDLEEYGDDAALENEEADIDGTDDKHRDLDEIAPADKKKTALSAEDEAELARELADLENDIETGEEDGDHDKERRVTANLPSLDESDDTDVDRLLAETDHQMDEPESATRRDAFAHLRAAVAAKKADVAAGEPTVEETSDDAYRDDLAQVVRPRRPISGSGRTDRPKDARPAPLKLVAEQRIDVAKPVTEGPVRPRRISAQSEAVVEAPEGESFVDFASDMGASTLPQLLEAAAAYMSFVEGREQFSRPQLMSKVRQAGGEDGFTREETLRSFGQLLRNGKIEKIRAGRFTVSDDIGFRPDERAAG